MKNILFTLATLFFSISIGKTQCNHPDYAGLMELYYSTGGPNWKNNTGWKEGAAGTNCNPCGGWRGITCINNRVTEINLASNNLVGSLPNITNLPNLERFSCERNQITGSIPNFTNLPRLEYLFCFFNQLTGSIPNFTNLPNLKSFNCSGNKLTGSIPNFTNLPNLESLSCGGNQLTGSIPNFTNLPNLKVLYCWENQLTGSIPNFTNLPNLDFFFCFGNQLSGNIPDFSNLPSLKSLSCGGNLLSGNLPGFTKLLSLTYFEASNNNLSGPIPDMTSSSLTGLTLSNNKLTGKFPKLPKELQFLDISKNELTGRIEEFPDSLFHINCSFNKFEGEIPNFTFRKDYVDGMEFNVSNNSFTGRIPEVITYKFWQYRNPVKIDFSNNDLVGCYPSIYCQYLVDTIYKDNQLGGISFLNNKKLPYSGDLIRFCNNGSISTGAPCDDGLATTIEDHILPDCSCLGAIADTCLVTIYDTLIVRDTITEIITDTTFITVTKEVAVTDTLIINLNLMNSANQPVENHILIYPNPASSHIYIDMGDHTLLDNYDMQILNALGQPVYFTTIDKKLYYIDLNGWSGKGTYFVKIKNPNGTTIQTKKIVLQ
jgi:hypothetical protein